MLSRVRVDLSRGLIPGDPARNEKQNDLHSFCREHVLAEIEPVLIFSELLPVLILHIHAGSRDNEISIG
jgi:hypothetical protein